MKTRRFLWLSVLALFSAALVVFALREPTPSPDEREGGPDHEEAAPRGPHGGRLLTEGDFAVELTIFERGVPPEMRAYAFDDGKPVSPSDFELAVQLGRLGGRVDRLEFRPEADYRVGDALVEEPHSFDVEVTARRGGRTYHWQYAAYEGRVRLAPEAVARSGIVVDGAGPATVRVRLPVYGRVVPNEDRLAHVVPRFPGVIREMRKHLGDPVRAGEALAVVESNESLRRYEVKSEIAGTVIRKHGAAGELAGEDEEIYVVADLSTVWVDLDVYRKDFSKLRVGQTVLLDAGPDVPAATAKVDYLSPFTTTETQTLLARAILKNPDGHWRPGLFVTGEVVVEEISVPVAVRASALQSWREMEVVFVREGDLFEVQPVQTGRKDGDHVEVTSGLAPGRQYVAEGSFVIKADIGKSAATHDH